MEPAPQPRFFVLDSNGVTPVELDGQAAWIVDRRPHVQHCAMDKVDGRLVLTMFYGVSAGPADGPVLCFETTTFSPEGAPEVVDRYHTLSQALAGHAAVVRALKDE